MLRIPVILCSVTTCSDVDSDDFDSGDMWIWLFLGLFCVDSRCDSDSSDS